MSMRPAAPPSLKAHALALLARREYSQAELREKLNQHARKLAAHAAQDGLASPAGAAADRADSTAFAEGPAFHRSRDRYRDAGSGLAEVEEVLGWLQAERHQSDERFLEVRVRSKAPGLGHARIRQELGRHGLQLAPELVGELKATELERARALWLRRYGEPAMEAAARAKQARFLAARGFSADVIRRVVGGRED